MQAIFQSVEAFLQRVTPLHYLLLTCAVLAVALLISALVAWRRSALFNAEATKLGMQFSHLDRFHLSRRVAFMLPVPGAAEVTVRDVAYLTTDAGLACVMTAAFTIGTFGRRRHIRRVCAALDVAGKKLGHFRMFEGIPTRLTYAQGHAHLTPLLASGSTSAGADVPIAGPTK